MEQMKLLIEKAKDSPIYIQVLLNALCGLRRQEINAVKYSDIDYINRVLYIERQLGKGLRRDNDDNDNMEHTTKNVLPLKTSSSKRTIPIPDILMEAILDERKKYEKRRSRHRSQFKDLDYICCGAYGSPEAKITITSIGNSF